MRLAPSPDPRLRAGVAPSVAAPAFAFCNCAFGHPPKSCSMPAPPHASLLVKLAVLRYGAGVSMCEICGVRPPYGKGEHVFPAWYLKDADAAGQPKFGWTVNGQALMNRDGDPLQFQERQRLLLPACRECNAELDTRIEKAAKELVRTLVANNWSGELNAAHWTAVGVWLAKILLFATHKRAQYQHPEINKYRIVEDWNKEDFSWLVNGDSPPPDLSLWIFRASQTKGAREARVLFPRSVRTSDGELVSFKLSTLTLEGISATLAWHPGWAIAHPLVMSGQAWELLHSPKAGDLADLPLLPMNAIEWSRPWLELAYGVRLDGSLPPLGEITDSPIPADLIDLIRSAEG